MDTVLPQPRSVPSVTEAALRVRDLAMMQVHNSKERELEEWVALLKGADERLGIKAVVQPFGSTMSVLEVVRDDGPETDRHVEPITNGESKNGFVGTIDGGLDGAVQSVKVLPNGVST